MTDKKQEQQPAGPQLQIHKIYAKDISFEIPNSQKIFASQWTPELDLSVKADAHALAEKDTHEVVLYVKGEVKAKDEIAFTFEIEQAGIFTISEMPEEDLRKTLGIFCPTLLYPYAREAVSDLVVKGGFPQLNLAPINFEQLYAQHAKE